jgi:hypothetical protein
VTRVGDPAGVDPRPAGNAGGAATPRIAPRAIAAVVLIACGGTSEPAKDPRGEPAAKPVVEAEPARDCAGLVGAVERITANEIAELFRTRAIEVARIAAAELERVAPTLREAMPRLCEADAWSGRYTACMTTAKLRADAQACQIHLTQGQLDKLAAEVKTRAAPNAYGGLPAECQQLIDMMKRVTQCPQMQQMGAQTRQQLEQSMQASIDQMVTTWTQTMQTPAGAQTTVEQCRVAIDAMKQSFTAMNCPL